MSENTKTSKFDSLDINDRPSATPEQLRAFHGTYRQLIRKATDSPRAKRTKGYFLETGEYNYVGRTEGPESNSSINGLHISLGGNEEVALVAGFDEQLVQESGMLGVLKSTLPNDRDVSYEFYPDGNIRKAVDQIVDGAKTRTHEGWLSPAEIEDLGTLIEQSR